MSEDPTREDSTRGHSFDELARAVADGSLSRRRALKLFAGTAIAALIPSRALAEDDDDCVRVCHVPFDRETEECDFAKAETRCLSRRERRRHLENHPCDCRGRCANCLTPPCQPVGGTCSANDQCCSGRCAGDMCAEPCPSGTVTLSNGTCATACSTDISVCSACADASCTPEISGVGAFCREGGSNSGLCATTSDCPSGRFCAGGMCVVACG